ncbi:MULTISPECIES: hypothetical protein [unclassified Arcicella]|uniref:hypothetical protein n=1 Tax=unclassified Arcicella TaxID=2644986 RepID=UPI0028628697|nr:MULTISPECIES: hypothetical protein [unclassified Arcicella]MDR6563506.1 hypothetical protein [Arcicella sp. BE51]MDR6813382.1 hypothetical protein [Arcicella sp. BE140]MDR6824695.1 hypothetical protein [Arcicella sp. BE139]
MRLNNIIININAPINTWKQEIESNASASDFIIINKTNSDDNLIWFITNYTQALIREGNNEVTTLFGKNINNLESFIYQVNLSMPIGYKLSARFDALYDLLMNFETEPQRRFIIWNDANYLLKVNKSDFHEIFELLIVSAYCNRNAISTIKDDGTRYVVDQRNIFVLNNSTIQDIQSLIDNEYHIPSIDNPTNVYKLIDFNVIELYEQ